MLMGFIAGLVPRALLSTPDRECLALRMAAQSGAERCVVAGSVDLVDSAAASTAEGLGAAKLSPRATHALNRPMKEGRPVISRALFVFLPSTRNGLGPDCCPPRALVCCAHDAVQLTNPRRPPLPKEVLQVHP